MHYNKAGLQDPEYPNAKSSGVYCRSSFGGLNYIPDIVKFISAFSVRFGAEEPVSVSSLRGSRIHRRAFPPEEKAPLLAKGRQPAVGSQF